MKYLAVLATLLLAGPGWTSDLSTPAPDAAAVYFITPSDGETVATTFPVRFGLSGMGVAPAGIELGNTGHHHLLINLEEMPGMTVPLPATEQIVHFGGGQTETLVTLEPGTHRLRLLLGNHLHVPHTPPVMSPWIEVTVAAED